MCSKYKQEALKIIKNNKYLTLATTSKTGHPWAATLYYCMSYDYVFYFISQLDSLHTQHILKNPEVAFTIFDSHQREGAGNGVQGKGRAYLVPNTELDKALKWYHTTFITMKRESFCAPFPYRMFKIIPSHFYILDLEALTDKRIEVYL